MDNLIMPDELCDHESYLQMKIDIDEAVDIIYRIVKTKSEIDCMSYQKEKCLININLIKKIGYLNTALADGESFIENIFNRNKQDNE